MIEAYPAEIRAVEAYEKYTDELEADYNDCRCSSCTETHEIESS
jgi:hypothetical protein